MRNKTKTIINLTGSSETFDQRHSEAERVLRNAEGFIKGHEADLEHNIEAVGEIDETHIFKESKEKYRYLMGGRLDELKINAQAAREGLRGRLERGE